MKSSIPQSASQPTMVRSCRLQARTGMVLLCCAVHFFPGGCTSVQKPSPAPKSVAVTVAPERVAKLEEAATLYDLGRFREALDVCIELSMLEPDWPELIRLRVRTLEALLDVADQKITAELPMHDRVMIQETAENELIPPTYLQKVETPGKDRNHARTNAVQVALQSPVSLHLQEADLGTIIEALSRDAGVNLIADTGLAAGKTINVEVDNLPLSEFLDYLSRNFDIDFYFGSSVIWAAPPGKAGAGTLKTRVYQLNNGLQLHGNDWGPPKDPKVSASDIENVSFKATVLSEGATYIEEVLKTFVQPAEGATLLFDRNSHTLIVKDTPSNLSLIEDILNALDVAPPQIFIEARFVELMVADLREVGLDWVLDSPLITTKKPVVVDGQLERVPRTVVGEGDVVTFNPYTSDADGPFPLGPQGVFGLTSQGNPSTVNQGLNLTYQGILTEPMFQAVLHALEISGSSRTLSVPRVAAVNNTPAKMRQGEDLLYFDEFEAQAFSLLDDNSKKYTVTALVPKGKPLLEELGITLVAVPSVGADLKTISLMLTPTISRLERFVSYQDDGDITDGLDKLIRQVVVKLPVISRREVQTKVIVESGQTVVMGGLIDNVSQTTTRRVPILGSIPGLGKLFSREDVTEQRRNLLIFVTATVVSNRGESLVPLQGRPASSPAASHGVPVP